MCATAMRGPRRERSGPQLPLDYAADTCTARGPLGLVSTSNETRSPPARRSKSRGATRPPRWKKYSLPSSAAMNPKPRSATTFLIVPVAITDPCILFPNRWQTHGPFEKKGDHAERHHKLQQRTQGTRSGRSEERRVGK